MHSTKQYVFFHLLIIFTVFCAFWGSLNGSAWSDAPTTDSQITNYIANAVIASPDSKHPAFAIIVEKKNQRLYLYQLNEPIKMIAEFKCSTGENSGPKKVAGDKKTPEGIYFFTQKFEKKYLSEVYGNWAFPTDYPNSLDRQVGRNGDAIWLHGTNKPIKDRTSNGCIALANDDIDQLEPYISLNSTPIIILDAFDNLIPSDNQKVKSDVKTLISEWHSALTNRGYHEYLKFYDDNYAPDISWWNDYRKMRDELKKSNLVLTMEAENLAVYKHRNVYVALFDQYIKSADQPRLIGSNKLFLKEINNQLCITGEEYLNIKENESNQAQAHPLVIACRDTLNRQYADHEIATLIEKWLDAWSSKDIKSYGGFYAKDFRANGKNLNAWLKYKKRLNRKYRQIYITKKNLKIKKGEQKSIAEFHQTYTSDSYKAVGIKRLILKREKGQWKIYRETWKKT